MFIIVGAVKIPDSRIEKRFLAVLYSGWLVVSAFVALGLSQFCQNEVLPERGLFVTVLGILLIIGLFLIPVVFTLKIRITVVIVSAILILFSCANYFVFAFRGSEIAPADLLSITTAGNVAANYSFVIPPPMYYAVVLMTLYFFLSYALPAIRVQKRRHIRFLTILTIALLALFFSCGSSTVQPLSFMQEGSVLNGYLLNFTRLISCSFPIKPSHYSPEASDRITSSTKYKKTTERSKPDVVVIMDESFADLSILGNTLITNRTITPFMDSLNENTVKGYTLSSVFGGGTPNSEYEFLSRNTLLFLPTGAVPYQQYIKRPHASLVRDLMSCGYSTIALHQAEPRIWLRSSAWPLLGFEKCLFLEDFPQQDMLRNWGTDQELFEKLASVYEEHRAASDSPVFMFAVTIQNHGGYDYSESDFTPEIHLEGYSESYPDVEQYLTCIHETDKAVQWLIDYFAQADRDVVVLFYGDHFPRLSEDFFEEVHGGPFETLDERMLQYEVPFFIWTNYESESEELELTSMNYLAGLLYQRAGLELPPYNQFLEQLRQTVPACNSMGYYSKSAGGFLPLEDAQGEEKEALLEYHYLEWNSLFDSENRNEVFFPIN